MLMSAYHNISVSMCVSDQQKMDNNDVNIIKMYLKGFLNDVFAYCFS